MSDPQVEYTFTFDREDEKLFRRIMDRLDPDEFTVQEPITAIENEDRPYIKELTTKMTMEPEAASTFRFGMKKCKIQRYRTPEEEAEKKALEDANTIKVVVKVDGLAGPAAAPTP